MKNVACSRLVNMLYPEIQKGKEAMKTENAKDDIVVTSIYGNYPFSVTTALGVIS